MLKVDPTLYNMHDKLARAQINLSGIFRNCGEARVTLPLELSLPAGLLWGLYLILYMGCLLT